MTSAKTSGLLLHPTSLPGPFGIGDLGPAAYAFVDFLVSSGQSFWQVLPLGPTGYGNSPYSSYSAFAGNTLLISPQQLVQDGLLQVADLELDRGFPDTRVDFEAVQKFKERLLQTAFENFNTHNQSRIHDDFRTFCADNVFWLDDYVLYRALKENHDGAAWIDWEPPLTRREPVALAAAQAQLSREIAAQRFFQFIFFRQWLSLEKYCHERGIKIIGDVPIFVAYDSADVWTAPDQFKLNFELRPTVVAGVPPDYFSETGQLWGNPLYNWELMEADGYAWWVRRMEQTLKLFDAVRMDHFRGFAAAWEIPAGEPTAEGGAWVDGPGPKLFREFERTLGKLPLIAEDLGVITPEVEALRDEFAFPGMRVLQFGFGSDLENIHLPHNYPANVVAYTGTHDNDTVVGWFESVADEDESSSTEGSEQVNVAGSQREFCLKYLKSDGAEIHWDFIDAVFGSPAQMAVVPLQDVLGLGNEARMNLPSSTSGSWEWRFREDDLTDAVAGRLKATTKRHLRNA